MGIAQDIANASADYAAYASVNYDLGTLYIGISLAIGLFFYIRSKLQ